MARDLNLFFDLKLDTQAENPSLKKKYLAKQNKFKEPYDLCDICRVKNTKSNRLTLTQKPFSIFF